MFTPPTAAMIRSASGQHDLRVTELSILVTTVWVYIILVSIKQSTFVLGLNKVISEISEASKAQKVLDWISMSKELNQNDSYWQTQSQAMCQLLVDFFYQLSSPGFCDFARPMRSRIQSLCTDCDWLLKLISLGMALIGIITYFTLTKLTDQALNSCGVGTTSHTV